MKASILSLVVILIIVLLIVAYGKKNKVQKKAEENENPYMGLREQVLNVKASDINIKGDGKSILACLMEFGDIENGSATLVMVKDGTVSIYFSPGGGIIGAGQHDFIRAEAQKYMEMATKLTSKMEMVSDFPLPGQGNTGFYVIREDGIFRFVENEDKLGNKESEFSELFYTGQNVITLLREYQEKIDKKE